MHRTAPPVVDFSIILFGAVAVHRFGARSVVCGWCFGGVFVIVLGRFLWFWDVFLGGGDGK